MNLEALKEAIMRRQGQQAEGGLDIDALLAALMPQAEGEMPAGGEMMMEGADTEMGTEETSDEEEVAESDLAPAAQGDAQMPVGSDDMAQMVAKMMASRGKKQPVAMG